MGVVVLCQTLMLGAATVGRSSHVLGLTGSTCSQRVLEVGNGSGISQPYGSRFRAWGFTVLR